MLPEGTGDGSQFSAPSDGGGVHDERVSLRPCPQLAATTTATDPGCGMVVETVAAGAKPVSMPYCRCP